MLLTNNIEQTSTLLGHPSGVYGWGTVTPGATHIVRDIGNLGITQDIRIRLHGFPCAECKERREDDYTE
jgi:hypothetical protein